MSHCSDVQSNFFQPFYDDRIRRVKGAPAAVSVLFDLAILKFWCSVIDFYGGVYYVGKHGKIQTDRKGKLKLATGKSFAEFIEDFFPSPENNYGKFIYDVFRSGVVHQLSPKRSGIHWKHVSRNELLWVEIDSTNSDPTTNKVAHINLEIFQNLCFDAYLKFYNMVTTKSNPPLCDNIYNHLISVPDVFGDGQALNKAYNELLQAGIDIKRQ